MTTTAEPEPFAPPDALDEASAHLPPASPTPLWRRIDRLVMVVFAIGISIPAVVMLIGLRPAPIENRPLLTPPPASAERMKNGRMNRPEAIALNCASASSELYTL